MMEQPLVAVESLSVTESLSGAVTSVSSRRRLRGVPAQTEALYSLGASPGQPGVFIGQASFRLLIEHNTAV